MRHLILPCLLACPFVLMAQTKTVTTVLVKKGTLTQTVRTYGTIFTHKETDISAQVAGKVTRILFHDGQTVKAGQVLMTLNTQTANAQLDSAIQAERLAYRYAMRAKQLHQQGAISDQTWDSLLSQYKQAKDTADQLRAQADYRDITAPYAGVMGNRLVTVGQYVTPGKVLVKLVNPAELRIRYKLLQGNARFTKVGALMQAHLLGASQSLAGTIDYISPYIAADTRLVTVEAKLNKQPYLRPGTLVGVTQAIAKPTPGFIIPAKSLQYDVKGPFVFLDNNSKALLQRVTVVHNADGYFIVTTGLKSGESVVVNGIQNNIENGDTLAASTQK